jgi:hypothetical protein
MSDLDGFGIWFSGAWNGGNVSAPAVQYEHTGTYGVYQLYYPSTESVLSIYPVSTDYNTHSWEVRATTADVRVFLDGVQVLRYAGSRPGNQIGFRTWRSTVSISNLQYQ